MPIKRVMRIAVFLFIFAGVVYPGQGHAFDPVHCAELLIGPREALPTWSLTKLFGLVEYARQGKLATPENLRAIYPLSLALRRRAPESAAALQLKMEQGQALSEDEVSLLKDALVRESREADHAWWMTTKSGKGIFFRKYGYERLKKPINPVDRVWLALGYHIENGEIIAPTHQELAENLARYQKDSGITEANRIKVSRVHKDFYTHEYRYNDGAHLSPGTSVRVNEAISSPEEYTRALNQNVVLIERGGHDVGHLVGWVAYPEVFERIKRLALQYASFPQESMGYLRFYWASEFLSVSNQDYSLTTMTHFLSRDAWKERATPFQRFQHIKKEIAAIPIEEVKAYIKSTLIPRYAKNFVPIGGGQARYGEIEEEGAPRWGKQDSGYLLERYFTPEMHPTFSIQSVTWEQPRMLEFQLEEVLSNPKFEIGREKKIREMVSRMEFFIGEYSAFSANDVMDLFLSPTSVRKASRLTEVYRVLWNKNSITYRALAEE